MIIGISGFKGSGKDTVANIIAKYGFKKDSFASPLKDITSILFGWDKSMLEGDTPESRNDRELPDPSWDTLIGAGVFKNDVYISPRIVLQRIGTELFRDCIHPDFWTLVLKHKADKLSGYSGLVIPDARFLNELNLCDITIRVVRNSYNPDEIEKMHISETEHLKHSFTYTILNTGTISDLEEQVLSIMNKCNLL